MKISWITNFLKYNTSVSGKNYGSGRGEHLSNNLYCKNYYFVDKGLFVIWIRKQMSTCCIVHVDNGPRRVNIPVQMIAILACERCLEPESSDEAKAPKK
jgi:hypothetical protein